MPGDELHDTAAAGARSKPRHAAPRKPLLTRFHVPAGKAIALAAMPSAVLMGMGFTPQLAVAKPAPKSPFKDGPCVTAPDQQEQEAQAAKKAEQQAAKEKAAKEAAEKAEKEKAEPAPSGGGTPSPSASKDEDTGPAPSSPDAEPTGEPSATPSPSASADEENPWYDPLGLGKKIEDAFTPGDADAPDDTGAAPSPSPSASGSATGSAPDGGKVTDPVKDTADRAGKAAKDAADGAGTALDGAKDTADKALPTPSPSPSEDAGAADADGKKPFPCVVEKKSQGTDEQPPATVPNDPWQLESSALTLRELDYKGVVNLTTPDGRTKQALKFTAESIDIGDLHQIVQGPNGKKYHVQAAKGSTSTIRNGTVTMYTERLEGNLFGLIPIVFDPEHPPPINVPFAYFTKVKITQAGQFGGTLTVPGMHQNITD